MKARVAQVALVLLALLLTGCETNRPPFFIEVASTSPDALAVEYTYVDDEALHFAHLDGITPLEVGATPQSCDHSEGRLIRIVKRYTNEILYTLELDTTRVCVGARLLWDGETLRVLDPGGDGRDPAPWPEDIYRD